MAFQRLPLQFVEPVRLRLQHRPPLVEVLRMVVGVAEKIYVSPILIADKDGFHWDKTMYDT
ncbi:MAG: hypothetical protein ACFNTM_05490 [Cardiobacterium sp.]